MSKEEQNTKSIIRRFICITLAMIFSMVMITNCGLSSNSYSINHKKEPVGLNIETEKVAEENKYTINNEVIIDDENCTFIIDGAEEDNYRGDLVIKVFCENKTENTNMEFLIFNVSVNGYMVPVSFGQKVTAGKKSNNEIRLPLSDFEDIGITTADEIIFTLEIYDYDNWKDNVFIENAYTIYPTGLSADEVSYPKRRTASTEQVIVDNEDASIIFLDSEYDSIWGYILHFYIENKTNKTLCFYSDETKVNGYSGYLTNEEEVAPDMRCYFDIAFTEDMFERYNIASIDEIEYNIRIYDATDRSFDVLFDEVFTYNP